MPVPMSPEDTHHFIETTNAPAAHLDMLNAMSFRTGVAGLRLGVYEALRDGPLPTATLAERTGTDPTALRLLLDALVGYGYLKATEDGYDNSDSTTRWLLRGTPGSFAPVLSFWGTVLTELWRDLETSVRQGGPTVDFYAWLEERPDTLADFQAMLRRAASWLADEVVPLVPAPPANGTMLDLGGGHGGYTIAFCQAHPQLRARILDLPGALSQGRAAVEAAQLTDRIELCPGDLMTADLGTGYDLVLLFNIVHGYQEEQVAGLFERVAQALRPGGRVVLLEPLAEIPQRQGGIGDAFVRGFSLNLFHTQGGRAYRLDELTKLLATAGFGDPQEHLLARSGTDHLVIATRL